MDAAFLEPTAGRAGNSAGIRADELFRPIGAPTVGTISHSKVSAARGRGRVGALRSGGLGAKRIDIVQCTFRVVAPTPSEVRAGRTRLYKKSLNFKGEIQTARGTIAALCRPPYFCGDGSELRELSMSR